MPTISLTEAEIIKRCGSLHKIFDPLRVGKPRVACQMLPGSSSAVTIGVKESGTGNVTYRQAYFSTSVSGMRCQYFEIWPRLDDGQRLMLKCAYFSLYRVVEQSQPLDNILALHADPHDDREVKRCPHFHVECAPTPFPKCHIPLAFEFRSLLLKDLGTLTNAMTDGIKLVADHVLPEYQGA